jgi:hypothetical protein
LSSKPSGQLRQLTQTAEVLLRQVHPLQLDEDAVVQSAAFVPGSNDSGLLSTLRESVGPGPAFARWTDAGYESAGTWGISVGEAVSASLTCVDDSGRPDVPADHASIEFNGLSRKGMRKAGRVLRDAALARGCLHAAPDE